MHPTVSLISIVAAGQPAAGPTPLTDVSSAPTSITETFRVDLASEDGRRLLEASGVAVNTGDQPIIVNSTPRAPQDAPIPTIGDTAQGEVAAGTFIADRDPHRPLPPVRKPSIGGPTSWEDEFFSFFSLDSDNPSLTGSIAAVAPITIFGAVLAAAVAGGIRAVMRREDDVG
ncbi:MAG: hypothetical protein AAGI17_04735 [Planctomycetota bacterium]